eukprot:scaffold357004_cov38-Prasinocladus_malaysianus.AAC.1
MSNESAVPLRLQLWVQFADESGAAVTYRLGLLISWQCPEASDSSECAISPEECEPIGVLTYHKWNPGSLRCERKLRLDRVAIAAVLCFLVLAAILLVGVFLRRLSLRAKVLAEELESLK